jgi:hypothetical protein
MISESWEDTIQPFLAPGSELTIDFGVWFPEEREDGLELLAFAQSADRLVIDITLL